MFNISLFTAIERVISREDATIEIPYIFTIKEKISTQNKFKNLLRLSFVNLRQVRRKVSFKLERFVIQNNIESREVQ